MVHPSTLDSGEGGKLGPFKRYGRYTLIKKLATGGMAEIWLSRQRGLADFKRFVVVKKILRHLAAQDTFVRMFLDHCSAFSFTPFMRSGSHGVVQPFLPLLKTCLTARWK